jgi:hypothetical protein
LDIDENLPGEEQTSEYIGMARAEIYFKLGVRAPFFQTNETQNL